MDILEAFTTDHLKDLKPAEVAAWYGRLADFVERNNSKVKDALAPRFLRHYLKGGGKTLIFDAPEHLRNSKYVIEVLKDHRAWYLTEKKRDGQWVGMIPRLQDRSPVGSGMIAARRDDISVVARTSKPLRQGDVRAHVTLGSDGCNRDPHGRSLEGRAGDLARPSRASSVRAAGHVPGPRAQVGAHTGRVVRSRPVLA